ncbi:MAG TPA: hypothetical protein VD927_07225 [Chryseosolibacter sp.]|nr:hypothetical protein [Chryseosolibacter sp.]
MKSTIQQQVAAFDKVLGFCGTLGSRYQPIKESINPSGLQETLLRAKQSMELVNVWWEANTSAISERSRVHRQLPVLTTRVVNSLALAGAPSQLIEDVMNIKRRFYYQKPEKNGTKQAEPNVSGKGNPAAQLSYLSMAELFEKFLQLVKSFRAYASNETDLTIESLQQHLALLKRLSDNVRATEIQLAVARSNRNEIIRAMMKEAGDVKRYIRAAFGHASEEFRFVTKIKFH